MAELKIKENTASVSAFLKAIPDKQRRDDALEVAEMMKAVMKTEPKMWGTAIVGSGTQHYRYASGREGDWFRTGFSPRKDALTLYITSSFEQYPDLMAKLGKYKTGTSCLHIKRLTDVDMKVLNAVDRQVAEGAAPRDVAGTRAVSSGRNAFFQGAIP